MRIIPRRKRGKRKKRKFERITNWGEDISIQEEGNYHLIEDENLHGVEDWLIKRVMEEEAGTRDWLLEETSKPIPTKIKQTNLEVSKTLLKAGKTRNEEKLRKVN
jgi:hypothetical protein